MAISSLTRTVLAVRASVEHTRPGLPLAGTVRRMLRLVEALLGGAICLAVFPSTSLAAPGDLDPDFGTGGKVTTDITYELPTLDEGQDVAVQTDGKVVVAGTSEGEFALSRYNPDGSPDKGFSGDGRVTTSLYGRSSNAYAMAIQADRKIVVAGSTRPGPAADPDFALARYNANGSLDASFSGNGTLRTNFGGWDIALALAIQPKGRIVAVGRGATECCDSHLAVARYKPDGSPAPSLGGDGQQLIGGFFDAHDVALQPDRKIVLAGCQGCDGSESDFAVARLNPDGSLDSSFAGDGKLTTAVSGEPFHREFATAVAIQDDGGIVAGGTGVIARYEPDGTLDPTFSEDGKVMTPVGRGGLVRDLAIEPDGQIVAAGRAQGAFALVRYDPDGSLDSGFSGDGIVTTDFGSESAEAAALAIEPGGQLVAAGSEAGPWYGDNWDDRHQDFALARYDPGGALDPGFSDDGKLSTGFGTAALPGEDRAVDGALQSDGKIVVAGHSRSPRGVAAFALARYNPDGTLDHSFGDDGTLIDPLGYYAGPGALAIQQDGKILVGGDDGDNFLILRLNPDGTRDESFGDAGLAITDLGPQAWVTALALEADGRIVAVGTSWDGEYDFAAARYDEKGELDPSFSGDGWLITDVDADDEWATDVAIEESRRILVTGRREFEGRHFALVRYHSDGGLDDGFGLNGWVTTDFDGREDLAEAVGLPADGGILTAGGSGKSQNGMYISKFAVARYDQHGSLDQAFSDDGMLTTAFGGSSAGAALALQPDDKFVVGGYAHGDFALVRYRADGALDRTFSGNGKQTTAFGDPSGIAALAIQDDKLIGIGSSGANEHDFAVARYEAGRLEPDSTPP